MAVVLYRRRAPVVSMMSCVPNGWFARGRSVFRQLWARRNLIPQERAYLLASYIPPALITTRPVTLPKSPRRTRCQASGQKER
jgi:hypothetical protein